MSKVTHNFFIAGVQYHQLSSVINDIAEGDNLVLVPEPDNKFDPNAVRIEFVSSDKKAFIGFVPKKFSSEVAAALEIGKVLKCILVTLNKSAKPWEQAEVEVRDMS
jgi:hypothetical protein